jgi:prepilin-type N-terminal cleavage/methylation domain-containing protein
MLSRGFTLLELVIVVAIVSIAAAVAIPQLSSSENDKLTLALSEIGNAIRFAQSEAVRAGEVRAVGVYPNTEQVEIGIPSIVSGNVTGMQSILTHPVAKMPYDFQVDELPFAGGVTISNTVDPFSFDAFGPKTDVLLFDSTGTPFWLDGGTTYLLSDGTVEVSYAGKSAQLSVSPIGRVSSP